MITDYYTDYTYLAQMLGISVAAAFILIVIIVAWSLAWKGLALWKAARRGSKAWFIVLLIVNTLGILEILYPYVFSEIKIEEKKKKPSRR